MNIDSANNFCIPDTKSILKNDYPYLGRSLFFSNIETLEKLNDDAENLFNQKKSSSSHFLAPLIHEWIHSFHLDYIYKQHGYGGMCKVLGKIYPCGINDKISGITLLHDLQNKKFTQKENLIIFDELGEYSTNPVNQYLEVFSEAWTKFICNALDGYQLIQNPVEQYLKAPKELKNLLDKILNI